MTMYALLSYTEVILKGNEKGNSRERKPYVRAHSVSLRLCCDPAAGRRAL